MPDQKVERKGKRQRLQQQILTRTVFTCLNPNIKSTYGLLRHGSDIMAALRFCKCYPHMIAFVGAARPLH